MAEQTAVPDHDGVDRTQVGGVFGDVVEQRDDCLLERVGDVEPVVPEPGRPGQQVGEVTDPEPLHLGVDQPVGQGEALLAPSRSWSAGVSEAWIPAPTRPRTNDIS